MRGLGLLILSLVVYVHGQSAEFWNSQAKASIDQADAHQPDTGSAKNVIIFVGDGMDIATTVASRIRQGQLNSMIGESHSLSWESFDYGGLVKTYSTDAQTADSASTSTAMFSGVKTKDGVLGLDDTAKRSDCASAGGGEVASNLKLAHDAGKSTGFVTSDRVTGATPAALYAHSPERDWQSDADVPYVQRSCKDIAYQLIQDNDYINVILGGGRQEFMPSTIEDPEYAGVFGRRKDGNNLIGQWESSKSATGQYVFNKATFDDVDPSTTDYLLGLFEPSSMRFAADRDTDGAGEPSLAEMTAKSIDILSKNPFGYFLVVESSLIDVSHHAGQVYDALAETIELADAVSTAVSMTDASETLIVVTADHAHTLGIQGYQAKNNPILGMVDEIDSTDGEPYTTLSYVNGPGGVIEYHSWQNEGVRRNYNDTDPEERDWVQEAIVPLEAETHGGSDVAIYAQGPSAYLFTGVHEQNYIAHAVRYAACLDSTTPSACNP